MCILCKLCVTLHGLQGTSPHLYGWDVNLVLCIVDNGGRHRQSGKSKKFDVFQNCSQFTEKLGKEENEGQVDVLQNVNFVFYQEFL